MEIQTYNFRFEGKEYKDKNLSEVSEITNINRTTIIARLKKMPIQEAIDFNYCSKQNSKLYNFQFNGVQYQNKTLTQIARIVHIRRSTLQSRLNDMNIQEAIKYNYEFNGFKENMYDFVFKDQKHHQKNLSEVSKITGINRITLIARLKKMSIQEAIDKPINVKLENN